MNPQSNAVLASDVAVLATFGAFKVEDRISFIRNYDPKLPGIDGFTHQVIRFRNTDGKNGVSKPAQMVTVPTIKLPEEYSLLPEKAQRVLLGVFEDEQNAMLRSAIDSQRSSISWDEITLDKILDSLTAVQISQRLNKEQIENWARVAIASACEVRAKQIAEAKGFDAANTAKQIAGTLNAYVSGFCKLAAPVPNLNQEDATALKNLLLVAKIEDDMGRVLAKKLDQILNPEVTKNADL